jgi:hypothetical protein
MTRVYELWDTATRNLVDAFAEEGEALEFVRVYVREYGPKYPETWTLLWDDDDTDTAEEIAAGYTLLVRAGIAEDAARRHLA